MVSNFKTSYEFILFLYQLVIFALKPPKSTIKNEFLLMVELRVNSKLLANVSKMYRGVSKMYLSR